MEFFELGLGRIHQLVSEWYSFAIYRGLLYSISSLLVCILLLILLKKYSLFNRDKKFQKILAKSYFFYFPFIFTVFGFALGMTLSTEDYFKQETKKNITPLIKLVFPAYQSHVNTQWAKVVQTRMSFNQTVDEYVSEIVFQPRNDGFIEGLSTRAANFMVPLITKWGIESVVTTARDIALKQSEEQGYLETQKVKALLIVHSLNMFSYPPGLWDETNKRLQEKTAVYFRGMAGNIALIFLGLLIFPFMEMLFVRLNSASRKKKALVIMQKQHSQSVLATTHEILEEFEKAPREKPRAYVEIEIPKVYEN